MKGYVTRHAIHLLLLLTIFGVMGCFGAPIKVEAKTAGKIAVIGSENSGKEELLSCLSGVKMPLFEPLRPIGSVSLFRAFTEVRQQKVQVTFCDVWKQQKKNDDILRELKEADMILLAVDMTKKDSLSFAEHWIHQIYKTVKKEILLVGTKSHAAVLEQEDVRAFAKRFEAWNVRGCHFTSDWTGFGIADLLECLGDFVFHVPEVEENFPINSEVSPAQTVSYIRSYAYGNRSNC